MSAVSSLQVPCVEVLRNRAVVLDPQAPDRDRHPAILLAVVVHRTRLADLPADGNQFVERRLVNQVAGVVLAVPGQVGRQGVGRNRSALQKTDDLVDPAEGRLGKLSQLRDKILDWNWP